MERIALNSVNKDAAFCSSYKKVTFVVYCNNIFYGPFFQWYSSWWLLCKYVCCR